MKSKNRPLITLLLIILIFSLLLIIIYITPNNQANKANESSKELAQEPSQDAKLTDESDFSGYKDSDGVALKSLESIEVKPASSKVKYKRSYFYKTWSKWRSCNTRQKILNRDLENITLSNNNCTVLSGTLNDPYTGNKIILNDKQAIAKKVQIDHVVALSNAWQTGGEDLSNSERKSLANDDLELLAVSSESNQQKSDSDAANWLPKNLAFRCQYVARQIAIKIKYRLWITTDEKNAMLNVLSDCPNEPLPQPN